MPTKTQRILDYLPRTFKAAPRRSPLRSLVKAFGDELLDAENSLAALMRAHWVDHADHSTERIVDLEKIAALYGLSPRDDESVEGFREHLKRYVITHLEGTITVQGLLRVAADVLGVPITDSYEEMDVWWRRATTQLADARVSGFDAANLVIGRQHGLAVAIAETPAQLVGTEDFSTGVTLPVGSVLHVAVDGGPLTIVDVSAGTTLEQIVDILNTGLGATIAQTDGNILSLSSPTIGAASSLELVEGAQDVAPSLLGFPPHSYRGASTTSARLTGLPDLAAGIDLSERHFIRLLIDSDVLVEVDVGGAVPTATTLDEVRDAINAATAFAVASHDGQHLSLTSSTTGAASNVVLQSAAAQDAAQILFGVNTAVVVGRDESRATVSGTPDLSAGVDLTEQSKLSLSVDGALSVEIDCRGQQAESTQLPEIVFAINAAVGSGIAGHDGQHLILRSHRVGPAGELFIEHPLSGDAAEALLGIGSRLAQGADASSAKIIGEVDLSAGIDLRTRHLLSLSIDGGDALAIDLSTGAVNSNSVQLPELIQALEDADSLVRASTDGAHLIIESRSLNSGRLELLPTTIERNRHFVTRAAVKDEAGERVFGFSSGYAVGAAATAAKTEGAPDLSRGVDLSENRYLRLSVDTGPLVDMDCAGVRPRATTLDEIVAVINSNLGDAIAVHDRKRLFLTSPTTGSDSAISFKTPQAANGLETLLGVNPGTVRGRDASGVIFVGTANLSAGVDLSVAAAINIVVDGGAPLEIACAGVDPVNTTLNQIVVIINAAVGSTVASHDGVHLLLSSPSNGATAGIEFLAPLAGDATLTLFGTSAPRSYQGEDASAAEIGGNVDLALGVDLSTRKMLRLGFDGGATLDVDCSDGAANPEQVTLTEIVAAINTQTGNVVAFETGDRLTLHSSTSGFASRVTLENHTGGDAREVLFGPGINSVEGEAAQPAKLIGEVDLTAGVDLSERSVLRLVLDEQAFRDIDVAGVLPSRSFGLEIVESINEALPGAASINDSGQLIVTAPSDGDASTIELLPLRHLELIEYIPEPQVSEHVATGHGAVVTISQPGVIEAESSLRFTPDKGGFGIGLADVQSGWQLRILAAVQSDETVSVSADTQSGGSAHIIGIDGKITQLPPETIAIVPAMPSLSLPSENSMQLRASPSTPRVLALNNYLAPNIVVLRQRAEANIWVSAVEAQFDPAVPSTDPLQWMGRLSFDSGAIELTTINDDVITVHVPPGFPVHHYDGRVVVVISGVEPAIGEPVVATSVAALFDVTVHDDSEPAVSEFYQSVTVGHDHPLDLSRQLNRSPSDLQLVRAISESKQQFFSISPGKKRWLYLECDAGRYDEDFFDETHFAGGICTEPGVFNVSRFVNRLPEHVVPVFADEILATGNVKIQVNNDIHRAGTVQVNLPADLPQKFGARFNAARFGLESDGPETFANVVTEPLSDPDFLVTRVADSKLFVASQVATVPLGFTAASMPFNKAVPFIRGSTDKPAKVYLAEEGLEGFIELVAKEPGTWGNELSVVACLSGPAIYDLQIFYLGARFEIARNVVAGAAVPASAEGLIAPTQQGVLLAKAAGVLVEVTRDRTGTVCPAANH